MIIAASKQGHISRLITCLSAVLGADCVCTNTSFASGYTFTLISDSNSPDLISLGQRKINDSGEVSFTTSPSFASYRVVKGNGGSTTQIASGAFWGLDWPGNGAIDNTGYVTFRGGATGTSIGIYRGNGVSTTPIAIGDQDMSTAGVKTTFIELSVSDSGNNIVWRQNTAVCSGSFMCGAATGSFGALIGGNGTTIAQEGAGWSSIPAEAPVINNAGQVAFTARSASDGKDHLVLYGGPNSGTIDGDYTGDHGYWMNNAGDVIFSEVQAVSLFHNGSTTTVASTADGFSHLQGRAFINDSGDVAFWANVTQYDGNPVSWGGVYTGPDIINDRVLIHGDTVLGHTINTVDLLGLNNAGQIVMSVYAQSPDPWSGLVVATPPPSADYNHNGIVDAADYVVWRKTNINGQAGYDLWRANYGAPAASGGGQSSGAVPEPASLALIIVGIALLSGRRV